MIKINILTIFQLLLETHFKIIAHVIHLSVFNFLLILLGQWRLFNLSYTTNLAFDNYDLGRLQSRISKVSTDFQSTLTQRYLVDVLLLITLRQWALELAVCLGHDLLSQNHLLQWNIYKRYLPQCKEKNLHQWQKSQPSQDILENRF
jgi:hypothetical protein